MAAKISRPRVFLDVNIGTEPAGRLTVELFKDQAPKTCENFRQLCTAENVEKLSYAGCPFHRIVDEFMIQGGDITKGNGTGGRSVYGEDFEDENLHWREIDGEGLLCMANRGSACTNSSQFFITLVPCPHLKGQNTVFGQLVGAKSLETLQKIAKVQVDEEADYKPTTDVSISKCGELVRRGEAQKSATVIDHTSSARAHNASDTRYSSETSTSRGRHKRRHSSSPTRSLSPSRAHGRASGSRHRHRHRRTHRDESEDQLTESSASTLRAKLRRRSDAAPDHTLRGRARARSPSRSKTPIREKEDESMDIDDKGPIGRPKDESSWGREHRHNRKRSPPPSRPRSRSPAYRRQRSLPNVYDEYAKAHGGGDHRQHRGDDRMDIDKERRRRDDADRDGRRKHSERRGHTFEPRRNDRYGRLGHDNGYSRLGDGDEWDNGGGIKYKGRGIMKFRETDRRW